MRPPVSAAPQYAGLVGECPGCGMALVVPHANAPAPSPPPADQVNATAALGMPALREPDPDQSDS